MAEEAVPMRSRSTWIYLAIALCLAGIYSFEVWQKRVHIAEKISSTRMFKIQPSEISSFSISKGGVSVVLAKANNQAPAVWNITSPIVTGADGLRVQKLLEKLSKLRWQRKISEAPENLSSFGLDSPRVVISFKGNKRAGTLFIGSPTPLGDYVYVQRNGDKAVYTITFADKFDLDVDLFDLRDKRLITLMPSEVGRVVIEWNGKGKWVLQKQSDKWIFNDDKSFEADPQRVQALLSRLWTMRATSIVEESCTDLSKYALARPRLKIGVWKRGRRQSQELWIGGNAGRSSGLYAKVKRNERVVTIRRWILSDIPHSPQGFKK